MLGIKKQFIKSMLRPEVVSNTPGKLQLYVAQIKKVEDEYKIYEIYAENALMLLKGVENLQVDYQKGIMTITYDTKQVSVQRLMKWLQLMIDVGIDYYDELKTYWEKQTEIEESVKIDQMWQKMRPILQQNLAKLS